MALNIPPGFEIKPDGTVGPVGPPGGTPNVGGTPTGALAPPGSPNSAALGSSVTQNPSGTTLNSAGPDIIPPNNSTIPPNKSVGPFTGGTSTDNAWDPRTWFGGNQPLPPESAGGFNPLSILGQGNPYWRGAIAAGGVLQPTPTANDAAPTNMWNQRPSGVGGMPGPEVTNPPDTSGILPQARGVAVPPDTSGILPQARGVAVPPSPAGKTRINPARVNLGHGTPGVTAPVQAPANSPFIGIDRPNSGPNERNRGSPQATALDLSSLFSHPAVAAAAAAHPAVQAAAQQARPDLAQRVPLNQTPLPPVRPRTSSTTSQGGGY
jgi:hypothetical protein